MLVGLLRKQSVRVNASTFCPQESVATPRPPLCTNLHNFLFIFIHFYARMTVWHIAFASERICAKYACT